MQNVKSTMLDNLLAHIAPHLCCACGKIGTILCESCKYDITQESFAACIICRRVTNKNGTCFSCRLPYERAWCVGERSDGLLQLLNTYKFEGGRAASRPLAELLCRTVGQLPSSVVVVPVPTISSHIRQRGYDHVGLVAAQFARLCDLAVDPRCLQRVTNTRQVGATRVVRERQARQAFKSIPLSDDGIYLLIDDIVTTGATIIHATKALQKAGAAHVWVAVVARQPLD